MKGIIILVAICLTNIVFGQTKYEKDFNEFWHDVQNNYAYFDQQHLDWNRVKELYAPKVKEVTSKGGFIQLMEMVLNELFNGHVSLNTNLHSSNRLIPSGQDMFVERNNDSYIITDLRKGYGAELSGLRIGDEILLFNQQSIPAQVEKFLPKATKTHSPEMYRYAVNMLFAGTHEINRTITVNRSGKTLMFFPDSPTVVASKNLVETKILNKTTAYIKINNALGNLQMIQSFDQAVDSFLSYKNLVIDLTETPGGGVSTVARCMMGRFIDQTLPYQQHEFDEQAFQTQRKWVEYVTPRKATFKGNVFVLVGHWTGSMGEGIAIGFDGMKRAKIIGTEMAKLLGAIDGFVMTETQIGFQIPTERLYHINGTPRENFIPGILTKNMDDTMQKMHAITE